MAFGIFSTMPTFDSFLSRLQPAPTEADGLTAEAFRQANQNQQVVQGARAFAGSAVSNEAVDDATLTQVATASNTKDLAISTPTATASNDTDLKGPHVSVITLGSGDGSQLSQGIGSFFQDQGGDQSSFGSLNDANGNPSRAENNLVQSAGLDATLNANNDISVDAPTNLDALGDRPVQTLVTVGVDAPDSSQPDSGEGDPPFEVASPNTGKKAFIPLNFPLPVLPGFQGSLGHSGPSAGSSSPLSPSPLGRPALSLPPLRLNPIDLFA